MGAVNFSGTGTGIDWNMLIDAEIKAREQQVIVPIQRWKSSWEDKLSAYDELRGLLTDLQSAVGAIDTAPEMRSFTAESSNESVVEATVGGTATPGTHSLEVNQLAAAETEIHAGVDDHSTVVNNTGTTQTFAYTYGGTSTTVDVQDGATLEQLTGLINNDPNNPGVRASILDDGSNSATSHHLVLQGEEMGAGNTITFDGSTTLAGDTGTLTADAAAGASAVTVDDAAPFTQYQAILLNDDDSSAEYHVIDSITTNTLNLKGTLADSFTTAQSAYATPRGTGSGLSAGAAAGTATITVTDASTFQVGASVVIADAAGYEEATISEIDETTGTLTLDANLSNDYASDGYVTQLSGGRDFSFTAADFTETQAARNAQVRLNGYPAGDWIERDSNVVDDLVDGVTLTLAGTTGGTPATVTVNEDIEAVMEKIGGFVDAYNQVRSYINTQTDYDPETEQAGALMGSYAATIIEGKLRNVIASGVPGFQDGADPFTLLGQVGIEQSGAGTDSGLGTLTVDQTELRAALAQDFEGVIRLFTDDHAGYSSSQNLTFYQASPSIVQAGKYDVEANFDGSGNLTGGRIKLVGESTWRSMTVDGSYLVGQADNPEESLWVRAEWDGASATQSAVVRITQGAAGGLTDALDEILHPTDGILHNIDESYGDIITQIDERIERETRRLELLRERLTARYARLEQYMVQMQGQQNWAGSIASNMGWTQ